MKFKIIYASLIVLFVLVASCENKVKQKTLTENEKAAYLKKGQEITSQSFAALGGKLQQAMKEGGVPNAINYCKLNAMPIVDSLSKQYDVDIRRVSLKERNPIDRATKEEELLLKEYALKMKQGESLAPIVQYDGAKDISYFAPITVNAFCLQCHGKVGETLKEEDHALIKEQYPNDKAIGYMAGDLRGMWRVTFHSSSFPKSTLNTGILE